MTVLSLQWLLGRPRLPAAVTRLRRPAIVTRSRRPAIVTRDQGPARCPVPSERRTYPDLLFADPVAVEDDSRRMRRGTLPAMPPWSWPASRWRLPR